MIVSPSITSAPLPDPFEGVTLIDEIRVDDDLTQQLQGQFPLEVQLWLLPMSTLRSKYHDTMRPLDKAMEDYMDFRMNLISIDRDLELGTAKNAEVLNVFDRILNLFQVYEKNQGDLITLLKKVHHQLAFYSNATKNDVIWNELEKLREIDEVEASRRNCCFEHIVMSLFKMDESIKDSLKTSQDIARCCASYLMKIADLYNLKGRKKLSALEGFLQVGEMEETGANEKDETT